MGKRIFLWQAAGFTFATFAGTILHLLYDWSNQYLLLAPFSGINESTWEHMKLLWWPLFLFALIQRLAFRDAENFWCIKLLGAVTGLLGIPVLFYTVNGIFDHVPDWVNITIFYVCAAASFLLEWRLFQNCPLRCARPGLALGILCFIGLLFVLFTFFTPQIPLFRDPVTGGYGFYDS